ncbi:MAG TPA: prepilin-type N-terminal cleavage/methylation domain-containing protein [Halomicronema sp.]
MKSKNFYNKKYGRSRKRIRGFTLIELLVSIIISAGVIMLILSFIVQMSETDRRELALTQTQRDMSFALDYMSNELKEAVYVYDEECLGTTGRGTPNRAEDLTANPPVPSYCPGLQNHLQFPAEVAPVLAFWKIESVPYVADPSGTENLPQTCPQGREQECNALLLNRSSYTFVMYGIRADRPTGSGNPTWIGPGRIVRYELRQYQTVSTLTPTAGYVDPTNSGITFSSWPRVYQTGAAPTGLTPPENYAQKEQVLVDLVDIGILPKERTEPITTNSCPNPTDYTLSKPQVLDEKGTLKDNSSFYTCIRKAQSGQSQDVFISIRGNALKRAGMPESLNTTTTGNDPNSSRNSAYLPGVSAQVQTRGVFNRNPS